MLLKVLSLLRERKAMKLNDIKNALDMDESAVIDMLNILVNKGKIKENKLSCENGINKKGCSGMPFSNCKHCVLFNKERNNKIYSIC